MVPVTEVTLLDHISVAGAAGEVTGDDLPGLQARLTLAHLVLHRRAPVPVDRLASAIWGEEPPATWRPALRTLVARVRAFVRTADPSAAIDAGPNGYHLHLAEPVRVDVEMARAAARHAEEAIGAQELATAVAEAAAAEELARGSFLATVRLPWVTSVNDELHDVRLRALHVLGEAHLLRGEPTRAARAAQEAIEAAPFHEASHRLAMRALAAAGETAEAAQVFDRCRRLLGDELGVTPSKQTTELLASILRDT